MQIVDDSRHYNEFQEPTILCSNTISDTRNMDDTVESVIRLASSFLGVKELGALEVCCSGMRNVTETSWLELARKEEHLRDVDPNNARILLRRHWRFRICANRAKVYLDRVRDTPEDVHLRNGITDHLMSYGSLEPLDMKTIESAGLPSMLYVTKPFERPETLEFFIKIISNGRVVFEDYVQGYLTDLFADSPDEAPTTAFKERSVYESLRFDIPHCYVDSFFVEDSQIVVLARSRCSPEKQPKLVYLSSQPDEHKTIRRTTWYYLQCVSTILYGTSRRLGHVKGVATTRSVILVGKGISIQVQSLILSHSRRICYSDPLSKGQ